MRDPAAGGHELDLSRAQNASVAEAILMPERATDDETYDFHVAVLVHAKSHAGSDDVLVDNPQNTPMHVIWIPVLIKREREPTLKPVHLTSPAVIPDRAMV